MNSRRNFLQKVALTSALLSVSKPKLFANQTLHLSGEPDEDYWKLVRNQFPMNPKKIFLNNGTFGPSPYSVIEAVKKSLDHTNESLVYGGGETEALEALATFLGVNKSEIALTHNVSEGNNIAAWGVPLERGCEVILSTHEHVGNATPWLNRAKVDGIKIKAVDLGKTAEETLDIIKKAIGPKTKVIAMPHIPCTIGQVLPIKEMCALAKSKGIYSVVDGAHPPGMLNFSIADLGCDVYTSCCHKWMLAPAGTAFIYVRKEFQDTLQTHGVGGGSDTGWNMLEKPPTYGKYADSAHRYYYGTQSAALYFGIKAAIDFQNTIGKQNIQDRILGLAAYLQEGLISLGNRIEMLTPVEPISRGAQIGFRIKDYNNEQFYKDMASKGIVIRYVPENGINNLRISTHIYNNRHDVETLIEEVKKVL